MRNKLVGSGGEKISVYGGTGFIGSRFVEMYGDCILIDREEREPKSDTAVYFISTTHNYNVFDDYGLDVRTNLSVLLDTLDKFRRSGGKTFNFISSWFVYGDCPDYPAKEDSHCSPKGFYSITKKCAEDMLVSYCKTFDIDYRIIRLCNVYGLSDGGVSKKKNALQYIVNRLKNNERIDLYNGGEFCRDYMYVGDVVRAIRLIIAKGEPNSIFNVGSGVPHRFVDLIELVKSLSNSSSEIVSVEPPEFHKIVQVKNMYLDNSRLLGLGFEHKVNIEDGMRLLCGI